MSKTITQKRGRRLPKVFAALVAIVLVIAMVVGITPSETIFAADYLADLDTTTKYKESLGDDASTEYAGRIWTDKTVYSEDEVTFDVYTSQADKDGGVSQKQVTIQNDSDFLVGLSALATSQSVSGQAQTPLDIVFVIDMSGSMRQNSMDNGRTRMANTIAALNSSVESLLATSPQTRVGVVAFSGEAYTLLELDHYTKLDGQAFFSTNSSESRIYTKAVGATKGEIETTTVTSSGTNIQRGIHDGLAMLLNVTDTSVVIDGKTIKRAPSVILLSDGAPTIGSSFESWWDLSLDTADYDYDTERALYAMQAIMTASYMKDAIDRHYGIEGTAYSTKVYSIGMGIQQITGENKNIASIAIDPANHINANNTTANTIRAAWETYLNGGTPALEAAVTGGDRWGNGGTQTYYTFKHPTTGYDIDSIEYVDQYYNADNAQAVTDVFDSIVSSISISAPEVPTEHDAANPMGSGYITFTDPIGEYMEVKDFKAILYSGHKYEAHTVSTTGNVTTYVFTETAEGNAVYGEEELNHIIIKVTTTTNADGIKSQVLTVEIPASLIPIRVNTVELNKDGTVKSHTNNGTYPIRVLYTVGLQDAVKAGDNISLESISDDYIAKHSNADGSINFYSNLYTGTNVVNGHTAGDTTAVFDAAKTNPFYYMQKDQILYTDINCTTRVSADTLDADTTYYYKETYYHGTQIVTTPIARAGAQLTGNTTVVKGSDAEGTYWYRPAGTVRVNRMLEFEGTKTANATNTAKDFYAPTYDGTTGHFKVYLGNNGVMSVKATGTLEFTKTVTAAEGLTAPNANFTFTVNLTDASDNPLTGSYAYTVVDANGNGVHEDYVSNGGTIVLKAGQTATIENLPPNAKYTLTESKTAGFTATEEVISGTITAGQVTSEAFANHYEVEKLTFPASSGLSGTKVLVGRDWTAGDTFTFTLSPYNDAPLPGGATGSIDVTVTTATDNRAEFNFGSIEFTKPGVYRYTIIEKEPENDAYLPGISYSGALYRLVVTVVDDGDGTLSATSDLQKLYTDDAVPLFTYDADNNIVMNTGEESQDQIVFVNKYTAESVVRVPVAIKNYTDHSGANPLVSGMFKFKLTPLGYLDAEGNVVAGTASVNPMPVDTEGNKLAEVITENEGHNVTFLPVTFTQADLVDGKTTTYRYQMEEVIPTTPVAGMTYSTEVKIIDVTISIDSSSNVLDVDAVYPDGKAVAEFTNVYDPVDAKAVIEGIKNLTGRTLNAGEFSFVLTDADGNEETVTNAADGTFEFAELTFDKVGTYTYNVKEVKGTLGGVTYDEHVCAVTINVKDNNGTLVAEVVYSDGEQATFNNTYEATFDPETAIDLAGTKELTGRPIKAGEFFFEVKPVAGAPMGAKATYVPAGEDATANASGVYEGAITFLSDVVYTEAGTYTYEISEVIPTDSEGNEIDHGVTYDRAVYTVTVKVTDDKAGTLSAAITKIEKTVGGVTTDVTGETIVFKNTYTPDEVVYVFRGAQKVLTGERYFDLEAGEFEFVRTATPTDGIVFYKADDPATAEDESLIEVGVSGEDVVANAADGTINFGNIKFTKVGTYVVTIKEVVPATKVPGVTYDTNVVNATFVVTDDLNGNLVVTITNIQGSQVFTNEYTTTNVLKGTTNLNVTKVLDVTKRTENTWTDSDVFTFELIAGDDKTAEAIKDGKIVLPATSIEIGKPASGNTNSKAFGDIRFYAVGTYSFIIREVAGTEPGMDYDATSRVIKVTTTDNGDGTLTVTVSDDSDKNPTFTNVFEPGDVVLPGHGNLHVNKVFTGRQDNEWLATDSFNFTLTANDDATAQALAKDEVVFEADAAKTAMNLTVTKDNKGVAHFGNITFFKAGTYTFVIEEATTPAIPGVTYDSDLDRVVTVVVTEKTAADNTVYLTAEIDYNNSEEDAEADNAFTFTNTYGPAPVTLKDDIVLEVSKALTGRNWMNGDKFTFELTAAGDATKAAVESDKVIYNGNVELTSLTCDIDAADADKKAMFAPITFTEPGSYVFYVNEVVPAEGIAGITYDKHKATIEVEVVDNKLGQLEISFKEATGGMTWTNAYTPDKVSTTLTGVKTLVGRDLLSTDKFSFAISAGNELAKTALPEQLEVTNNGSEIVFGEILFEKEGIYVYNISEKTVNTHGLTSDTGYVKATVEVAYDATTGKLAVANVSYEKLNPVGTETGFTFVNSYKTTGYLDGSINLNVVKHFLGRENNDWLETDSFEFKLAAGNDATVQAIADGIVTLPENATGITIDYHDVHKMKAFGNIYFTKAGQYQFVITETVPATLNGITYDSDVERTIIVNVVDNLDGTLTATVDTASESLEFTNKYDTVPATLVGATNLVVEKILSGREWLTEDTYSFLLQADMSHSATASAINAADPIIVMPADKNVTITKDTVNHKAAFGDIIFKEAGTYRFLVTEIIPSEANKISGITYTTDTKHINVLVTDNHDGTLSAVVEALGSEPLVFVNKYDAAETTVTLNGTKTMVGRDLMATDKFEFVISATDASYPMPATTTVEATETGAISFGKITFTAPGTYKYQIKEVIPANAADKVPGVTYDTSVYEVTVNVVDNNFGKLVATTTITKDGTAVDAISFANTYGATSVKVSVSANKVVVGNAYAMKGGEFEFEIDPATSNPAGDPVKHGHVYNVHGSTKDIVKFIDNAEYTKAGTYVYTVHEEVSGQTGITYDGSIYRITVTVTDDLAGKLSATTSITKDGNPVSAEDFVFTNTYAPNSTSALIHGHKVLSSAHKTELEAGLFQFKLEPAEGTPLPNGKAYLTATNTAAGLFQFEAITYHEVGTYKYKITEVNKGTPGYTYDGTAYEVTVEVTDPNHNGFLQAKVTGLVDTVTGDPVVVFTNGYVPTGSEPVVISGTKTLVGRTLQNEQFAFVLTDADGNVVQTVKNDASGNFKFSALTFSAAGTYKYTVKEDTSTPQGGITFDNTVYTATIVVTDKGGKLEADVTYSNASETVEQITFTNKYDTIPAVLEGEAVLGVTKVIDGRGWLPGDVFTFQLSASDSTTVTAVANDDVVYNGDKALESLTCEIKYEDSSKTKTFAPITFTKPGTYEFVVSEVVPEEADRIEGIQYVAHSTTIKVVVEDNGEGALVINAGELETTGSMTWTNKYTPNTISASLVGTKVLRGREMKNTDVFTFTIAAENGLAASAMPADVEVTNDGSHIEFGPMYYSQAGTYVYIISEKADNKNGITCDDDPVKAVVEVGYDASAGKLYIANIHYSKLKSAGNEFKFVNRYASEGFLDGSTHLNVTKHFTGRPNNAWLEGDSFEFKLAVDGHHIGTVEAMKAGNVILPENATGITISYADAQKEKAFGNIIFKQPGQYQFVITETAPASGYDKGITYDAATERIVIVDVTDNFNGTLTATVNEDSELLVFENKYDTTQTTLIGATNLVVEKVLEGREWIAEDTYSFELAADMDHAQTANAINAADPIIVMPAEKVITINKDTADHKAAFGDIIFKETGTYRFTVKEVIPSEDKEVPGVAYDHSVRFVTVHVVDNNDGTMTASVVTESSDNLVFTNTYAALSASATVHGKKVIIGRDLHESDKFEFTISVADGSPADTPLPDVTTVANAADGTITFAPITFNHVGEYKYVVKEVIPSTTIPGVSYDTNAYPVTVTVTDNKLGHLVATVTYGGSELVFTNTYQEAPTDVVVAGTKKVTTTGANSFTMAGGEFKFEIEPAQSNPSSDPVVHGHVFNDADGNVVFFNAHYTEEGTYRYTVHEEVTDQPGITFDSAVYRITVEVIDDQRNGQLVAHVTYMKDDTVVSGIEFNNAYNPGTTSVLLHGHKVLASEHKAELEAGLFQFKLEAVGNAPLPQNTTATNTAAGIFQFDTITYREPGEYQYRISEIPGGLAGYSYSNAVYDVTVKVEADQAEGKLHATVSGVTDANGDPIVVFTNGYTPAPVTTANITGTKTLSGRPLNEGEFTFALVNDADEIVQEVKNDAAGNFSFNGLTFTKAGTYYYTVKEDSLHKLGGVTYDETVYTVQIDVTDMGGYLAANVTCLSGSEVKPIAFNNTYAAAPVHEEIYALKTLSGRGLRAEEFTFELRFGDNVVQTKKNDASGVVAFDPITYNAVGEYVYTISEVKESKLGVTYDENTYTAIVKVTDNLDGQLKTTVSYVDNSNGEAVDQAVFKNAYIPTHTSIELTGKKILEGRKLVEGEFTFLLKNDLGEVVATATNTVDGKVVFDELIFNTIGTFEYTIVEDSSDAVEGMVYDDTEYTVVVTVTDDGEGSLVAKVDQPKEIIFHNEFTIPELNIQKKQSVGKHAATIETLKVAAGDVVTYEITVSNDGTGTAKNVVVTDMIPEGLTLVVGSITGGDEAAVSEDGMISWVINQLPAGKSATVSFQVKVPFVEENEVWKNIASVVYDNNPENPETPDDPTLPEPPKTPEYSNEVTVEGLVPEVVIEKTQRVGNGKATKEVQIVNAGDKVIYILTVSNKGEAEALDLTITDRVPEGLELIPETVKGADDHKIYGDGKIEWQLARLGVNESVSVSFQVEVPAVTKDTNWINIGTVVYANNPDNPEQPDDPTQPENPETPIKSNEVEIKEFAPELTISKAQKVNLGFPTTDKLVVREGDVVTYLITITNIGRGRAEDLVITDKIPAGLLLDEKSISDNGRVENGVIVWNIDSLDAGKDITVKFRVRVPAIEEDTVWKNIAQVVYGNNPENPADPSEPSEPQPSNEVEIEQQVVGSPVTSDMAPVTSWMMLAIASLVTCFGIMVQRKRENN